MVAAMVESLVLVHSGDPELVAKSTYTDAINDAAELFKLPSDQIQLYTNVNGARCRVSERGFSALRSEAYVFVELRNGPSGSRSLLREPSISSLMVDMSMVVSEPMSPLRSHQAVMPIAPLARRASRPALLNMAEDSLSHLPTPLASPVYTHELQEASYPSQSRTQTSFPLPTPPMTPSASPVANSTTVTKRRSVRFTDDAIQAATSDTEERDVSRRASLDGATLAPLAELQHPPLYTSPERSRHRKRSSSHALPRDNKKVSGSSVPVNASASQNHGQIQTNSPVGTFRW